jgi:hypothetical protein
MRSGQRFLIVLALGMFFILPSCQPNNPGTDDPNGKGKGRTVEPVSVDFNADSAYYFIQKQVDFGPRVPGTMPHAICANYLKQKLSEYCDTAMIQEGQMMNAKANLIGIKNIIGSFNPTAKYRFLLAAHWDTRPMADEDPLEPTKSADGANDGASGVGVLLEMARQMQLKRPDIGVDIIFFDAEDGGESGGRPDSWCLGSQYWSANLHTPGYIAHEAILLDMVGAKDASFILEANSLVHNQPLMADVWHTGQSLGYGRYFMNINGNPIIDDHVFVFGKTGIKMIDIISHDLQSGGFGPTWHTLGDNMSIIDTATLKAVGHTVYHVVMLKNARHKA